MKHDPCIYPGELLLPVEPVDWTAWACVACDQYTSQPKYWEDADALVGDRPSTLRLTIPECYLAEAEKRTPQVLSAMRAYLDGGVLAPAFQKGFVLLERNTGFGARIGLVALLDLESYDYRKGAQSPVRATEETIAARIPPRIRIRREAALETSHVIMLTDDPAMSVLEPLYERRDTLRKLYDFPLMLGGGHLTGYAVTDEADIASVYTALDALWAQRGGEHPLLFAVGDGNHSLATAKACWEEIKPTLTPEQTISHPARFAMVELENIHDDALSFEPIHRVLFGVDGDDLMDELAAYASAQGMPISIGDGVEEVICAYEGKEVALDMTDGRRGELAVAVLQRLLDAYLLKHPEARVDYVHGAAAARELSACERTVAFLLPKPDKDALFATVTRDGSLPRKTFSMGEANEKRYYMECRRLK